MAENANNHAIAIDWLLHMSEGSSLISYMWINCLY